MVPSDMDVVELEVAHSDWGGTFDIRTNLLWWQGTDAVEASLGLGEKIILVINQSRK